MDCPNVVLVLQARSAFDRKDFQKAEAYLLRAQRADLAANFYKVHSNSSNILSSPLIY